MLFKIGVLIYGYFAGALIQAGYWMGKFNKIDIRDYGSGNAGTTNVMRTLGKKAGIATYLLDAFKAVIADILIHFLIVPHTAIPEMLLFLYCGLGIVLGHNFPFYLKFKGSSFFTNLHLTGSLFAARRKASRAVTSSTPPSSNITLPGLTTATQ